MQILKHLLCGAALLVSGTAMAQEPLLAFPGAEGFGRYATGGRGGEIYHVTTTADSGTGSLRDAVSKSGRIIVFDVSGDIILKSPLVFKGNNTILGQTAPGEGINVYGDRVSFSGASNLIVRYIRFRMGINGTSGADACGVANGENMIFDHLSVFWGRDENFSVSWDNKNIRPRNITIQNSIIAQGLQSHSCGGLIQTIGGVTLYRNLYIENKTRNPKVKGLNQYVNNVVYNWGDGGAYIQSDSEGDSWADIENNYFMRGPWNGATQPFSRGIQTFRLYGNGNYYDSNKDGILNGALMTDDEQRGMQNGTEPYSTLFASLADLNANIDAHNTANSLTAESDDYIKNISPIVGIMSAADAYEWILSYAGASLPVRDVIDQYVIDEAASYGTAGTKNGISSELNLPHKGVTNLSGGVKPVDSDGDGIPDEWEIANGLNPEDPTDATAIAANGYANIENYAFSITEAFPYIKKPLALAATAVGKTSVDLTWDPNTNTEAPFEIEIAEGDGPFCKVAEAPAGSSSVTVEGLQPRTAYQVRVRSVNSDGLASDYTDVLSIETIDDPAAPEQSYNPYPAVGSREGVAAGITFSWETPKSYGGNVYYTLMLGTSPEDLAPIATDITATQYTCDDLTGGNTYYWRVDARNDIGSTEGDLWYFTATTGGVLFYTDFHTQPQAWADTYGYIVENTNIINAANTTVTCGGLTIGTRENKIRILNMPGLYSDDTTKDYGPATEEDRGATPYAIQFNTTAAGGYMTMPEVQGPCVLTLYLGNPDNSSKTVYLTTRTAAGEQTQALVLGAKKRVYKHTITYTANGPVTFELDANAKKFDVNDVLIERWVPSEGDEPLELTAGTLDNQDMSYADGSLTLSFNQEIRYNGGAEIAGIHQFENFSIGASGNKLNISYDCLDVLTEYTVTFGEGVLTDITGEKSFVGTLRMSTCDHPAAKMSGDNHWGKAAASLPLNFAPFDVMAPFETVGGLVQEKANDYPHWVQVNPNADIPGEATAEHAVLTTGSDKVMGYWEGQSRLLALELDLTGSAVVKVQESRNCDNAPGWRTLRIFTAADLPFKGELELHPETRFIKISAPTISGALEIKTLRISNADGYFGEDYNGIFSIEADGADDAPVYNLLGIPVDSSYRGIVISKGKIRMQR